MIFCGDISVSRIGGVQLEGLPDNLRKTEWFGNLEGTLVDIAPAEVPEMLQKHGVFNSLSAIEDLSKHINFVGFGLANNHIFNYGTANTTLNNIDKLGLSYAGLGCNTEQAAKAAHIKDANGKVYTILAFAWKLTESQVSHKENEGVNAWTRNNALIRVKKAIKEGAQNVVVFVHWNYEMNYLPFPYDRQLAHDLIDAGVTAIIGCHSHRVQPVEIYNGRPIIYGLGNFFFENNVFFNGKLNFPEISKEEFAFEIDEVGKYKIHVFHYDTQGNVLRYERTEELTEQEGTIKNLSGISAEEYEKQYIAYFKSKPRRQRILCPIFKTHESKFTYWAKEKERDLHEIFLKVFLKLRLHGSSKSGKNYR
jgi:poly-gamma-glutamate synthesis protein (capsule biosynthesis protein)